MQFIVSPTKQMRSAKVAFDEVTQPYFKSQAALIRQRLQQCSMAELQALWKCNQKLVIQNYERLHNAKTILGPAIMMYQGLQFQNMHVELMSAQALKYLQTNLWIMSGMYGLLRPFDEIQPYRLEMQAKLSIANVNNIYDYWHQQLYTKLFATAKLQQDASVINLASQEYAKTVKKYLQPTDKLIDVTFLVWRNDKLVQQATIAKQARGRMIAFCANNQIQDLYQLKKFNELGFMYDANKSNDAEIVFIQGV